MTKSTITREQLEEWVAQFEEDGGCDATDRQLEALIRQSLAAMNSEPVAYIFKHPAGRLFWSLTDKSNKGHDDVMPVYASPQPAPVVPEEATSDSIEILASARRRDHAVFQWDEDQRNAAADSWNACRSAMLQASPICTCPSGDGSLRWPCPVHPGNSPAIPDSARDALEKALAAMEFMGDTLNNLDAVCTEDVELVAPAFDAVRNVLAAAQQEGK